MELAKPYIDVGVRTNNLDDMLDFWQQEVGLPYEELLKLGGGFHQHRLTLKGSVFKLNHARDPLPEQTPSGYDTLMIASEVKEPTPLQDPDGNKVLLVPMGWRDVTHIGMYMRVRSGNAAERFFVESLEAEKLGRNHYRLGTSIFMTEEDPTMLSSGGMDGCGYRYLTIQVFKVDLEHAGLLNRGAVEGREPMTLGSIARISFITDQDNNWIEISQRASLTGDLTPG